MDTREHKQALRTTLKKQRANKPYDLEHAGALMKHMAEICLANGADRVACYLAHAGEPDTELFIDWALEQSIEVLLPRSLPDGTLEWVAFTGETEVGIFGFAEPSGPKVEAGTLGLVFVPALAVDQDGNRLGKGKGYYDRALETLTPLPPIVAVIFDHELLEQVPTENHDFAVDAVVTPGEVIRFTQRLN
jgi:5-formyltetrahydrofolate cyclo-ligase